MGRSTGANVNAQDNVGNTPLWWALEDEKHAVRMNIVQELLRHGADPDLGPKDHYPLQIAQHRHDIALIALLRKYHKHP